MSINKSLSIKMVCAFAAVLFYFQNMSAQELKSDFWTHVRFGGGLGLNFANGFFSATVAPSAVYEFDRKLALGLGLNATINNLKNRYKSTILGGSVIGLYTPLQALQISGELEHLNVNRRYDVNLNIEDENFWVPALYFGAGYRSGNVTFGVRYNVLFDAQRSIFADPWVPFVRFFF